MQLIHYFAFCMIGLALACPDHTPHLQKPRQFKRAASPDWAYEASYDWAKINDKYDLCQTGTMQSPIPLQFIQGLSLYHRPTFDFPRSTNGTFRNWGYGSGFDVYVPSKKDMTSAPSVTFEEDVQDDNVSSTTRRNDTAYLAGWHIHAPADHTVQGDRSKAELHFVFARADGSDRAVFAIRIDPGNQPSTFFRQLPTPMISYRNDNMTVANVKLDLFQALQEVDFFNEFWTYRGSLTSPPCTEGLRWFMARHVLFVSNDQMQDILRVSKYSARAEQEVWQHAVNV